jgi:hypothetical protein
MASTAEWLRRWRAALDDPAARQMTVLRNVFTSLSEWWTLVPDQSVITSGGNTTSNVLNLGARSTSGRWIIAYISGEPITTVNLAKLTAEAASARWIDPFIGAQRMVGSFRVDGVRSFTRPADLPDAVLVVSAVEGSSKEGSNN